MSVRRLFVLLFVVALFAMAVRETLDPDMWWHLRTGEVILAEGIPTHDVFSFTVPEHEWVTHEWGSQVFMWLVLFGGGAACFDCCVCLVDCADVLAVVFEL